MSVDLPQDEALLIKKRARRRLVGAIGMVLLMVIALPLLLRDRSAQNNPNAIQISMPHNATNSHATSSAETAPNTPSQTQTTAELTPPTTENTETTSTTEELVLPNTQAELTPPSEQNVLPAKAQVEIKSEPKPEIKPEHKTLEKQALAHTSNDVIGEKIKALEARSEPQKPNPDKKIENNKTEDQKSEDKKETKNNKTSDVFAVQVGVFSDKNNLAMLSEKLKSLGYSAYTENIATPSGEKMRLRFGKFPTKEAANEALTKIKQAGIKEGNVVSR